MNMSPLPLGFAFFAVILSLIYLSSQQEIDQPEQPYLAEETNRGEPAYSPDQQISPDQPHQFQSPYQPEPPFGNRFSPHQNSPYSSQQPEGQPYQQRPTPPRPDESSYTYGRPPYQPDSQNGFQHSFQQPDSSPHYYQHPAYSPPHPSYGPPAYGHSPYGPPHSGQSAYGQSPYGQSPSGNSPYEQPPSGHSPYEQPPSGHSPYGPPPVRQPYYGPQPVEHPHYGPQSFEHPQYGQQPLQHQAGHALHPSHPNYMHHSPDPHDHHVSMDHLESVKNHPHQAHLHRPMLFKYIQLLKNPENFTVLIRSIARMSNEQVHTELKRYTEIEKKLEKLPEHDPVRVFVVCMVNLLKNQQFFVNFKKTLPAMSALLMKEYYKMYPEDRGLVA